MKKKVLALFMIMVLACSLVACGSEPKSETESASGNSADGDVIVIGYYPWCATYQVKLAEEKGMFEKAGLKVELKEFPVYSDSLNAFYSGNVDIVYTALSDAITPLVNGVDFKVFSATDYGNGSDAIVGGEGINSIADLKGKDVAVEVGTMDHLLLDQALEEAGLSESDVNIVNMSIGDIAPAMTSGSIVAASFADPYVTNVVSAGKGKILKSTTDYPRLITDGWAASGDMMTNHKEDLVKFMQVWYEALAYEKDNPDESQEYMAGLAGVSKDEYVAMEKSMYMMSVEENLSMFESEAEDLTSLDYLGKLSADFLSKNKLIDTKPEDSAIEGIFDDSIMKEVAGK